MMQKCAECGTRFDDIEIHVLMNDGTLRCAPCGAVPLRTESEWKRMLSKLDGTIEALRNAARMLERRSSDERATL
jgi:predicted  nucleic acid-binding Zn-ribbon protein